MTVQNNINSYNTYLNTAVQNPQTAIEEIEKEIPASKTNEDGSKKIFVQNYQEKVEKNSLQYFLKSLTGLDVKLNMTSLDAVRAYVIEHKNQEAQKAYT